MHCTFPQSQNSSLQGTARVHPAADQLRLLQHRLVEANQSPLRLNFSSFAPRQRRPAVKAVLAITPAARTRYHTPCKNVAPGPPQPIANAAQHNMPAPSSPTPTLPL